VIVLRFVPLWRPPAGGRIVVFGLYLGAMFALFALAAHGAGHLASLAQRLAPKSDAASPAKPALAASATIAPTHRIAMSVPQMRAEGSVTLAQGWWSERQRTNSYWGDRSRGRERDYGAWRGRERDYGSWRWGDNDEDNDEDEARSRYSENRGTYRTLCVRLCDGFYWPISYATTPEYFERDRRKCESSCGSPVRLYKYTNPGGDPEEMDDLSGRPYSRLKTAFLYRTAYDASCKCKSDPWEQEAIDLHRMYALEAAKRKGDKVAAKELDELKASREAARREAEAAARTAATIAKTETDGHPSDTSLPTDNPASRSSRERMSLGASSPPPARPSGPPTRFWKESADNAP
jgi:hypothetical protein